MEYFAQLNENNLVVNTIVVSEDNLVYSDGNINEDNGETFCKQLVNDMNSKWKRTSVSGEFRGRFANIGCTYDENLDVFIDPQPYPSWSLNSNTDWESPLGSRPELNEDQVGKYLWLWDEDLYQSDNTKGWILSKRPE